MGRSQFWGVLRLVCWTSLSAACDSSVTAPPGTPPATFQIVSGDSQSGTVGTELANPLVAKVLDAAGRAIPGQIVNFRVTAGAGSVFGGAAASNDSGLVRERWTLGTSTTDSQRVEVRALDNHTGALLVFAVFKATALSGPATTLAGASGDGQSGTLGTALPESLRVKLTDHYGNPVPGDTVAWSVTVGGGTVGPTTATTDSAGLARAQWVLGHRLDTTNVAIAARTGVSPAVFTATPQLPNNAALSVTGGDGQTGVVGTAVAESLAVKVTLSGGTPVQGARVTWSGPGSLSPPASLTDAAGLAKARWTLPTTAGTQAGSAQVGALAPVPFAATATAGAPDTLAVAQGDLQVAAAGQAVPESLAVKVFDQFENPVPGASVSWLVTGGGGSISPSPSLTDGAGLARAQWTLGPSGSQRLSATVSDASGSSVSFRAGLTSGDPLQVYIVAPLRASLAQPTVSVTALCQPGRCVSLELRTPGHGQIPGGVADTSQGDTLQTTLSLSAYDGLPVQLQVTGHGFLGDSASDTATVYVETSSRLTLAAEVPGEIWDAQAGHILYRQDSAGISLLKIRNRTAETDTVVMGELGKFPRYGYLTPLGAMFVEGSGTPAASNLYEWRNGVLNSLGPSDVAVQGSYAIWRNGSVLTLHDVLGNTDTPVATGAPEADVASNGDVAYNTTPYTAHVYRFRGGTITDLAAWTCINHPLTDGTNVVYVKTDGVCKGGQLYLYDPGGDIVLTSRRDTRSSYALNNGWVTFTDIDDEDVPQIWTRSPTRQTRQVPAVTF